jgi:hypothetical protein
MFLDDQWAGENDRFRLQNALWQTTLERVYEFAFCGKSNNKVARDQNVIPIITPTLQRRLPKTRGEQIAI